MAHDQFAMNSRHKLIDWLDNRTGIRGLLHAALYEHVPGGARWRYVWGSTLVACFATQVVTGLFLWMAYSPSTQTAWESVFYIQYQTTAGWLLRGIHHYTAHAMVYLMVIHFVQVVIDGAYRAPRELNFVIGLLLMFIVMGMALTGYLLPWDQKGYWATSVGTNLASQAPVVGPSLKKLIIGGSDYGHHTLTRFFALHAGVLPGLLMVLLVAHVALFRRHGLTAYKPEGKPTTTFWPDQVLKDSVAALAVLAGVLAATIYWHGAELGAPADPANPYDAARPENYFLFLFQFLKWFPGELEVFGAFVIPGVVTLVLFAMPWIGRSRAGHVFNVVLLFMLLGGAALLTAQAMSDDNYAARGEKPKDALAADKWDASHRFLEAKTQAGADAERVIELASSAERIPPEGALSLVYDDSYLQGPRLFKQYCASCHNLEESESDILGVDPKILEQDPRPYRYPKSLVNKDATAPNLYAVGSTVWMLGILDVKSFTGRHFFGYEGSPFIDSDMATFLADSAETSADGAKTPPAAFRQIQYALSRESRQISLATISATDRKQWDDLDELGRRLITGGLAEVLPSGTSCVDCHKFHDAGELGSAPDLTGYMSREWMIDFVKNPGAERFYGDKNDRMPAFAPHDDPTHNQLDQKSIELIVDWLRGDWQRGDSHPASPAAK